MSLESLNREDPIGPNTPTFTEWINGQGCTLVIPNPTEGPYKGARTIRFLMHTPDQSSPFVVEENVPGNRTELDELKLGDLTTMLVEGRRQIENPRLLPELERAGREIGEKLLKTDRDRSAADYSDGKIRVFELDARRVARETAEMIIFGERRGHKLAP